MQIEALESALIETKLKYARDMERAQKRLAEMESQVYNTQLQGDGKDMSERVQYQIDTLKNEVYQECDAEDKVMLLEKMVKNLTAAYHFTNHERSVIKIQKAELERAANRDKLMFEKAQNEVENWLSKILFYQDTLFEVLSRTGSIPDIDQFNKKSPISREKQILLKELYYLNKERDAKIKEMERTYRLQDDRNKKAIELLQQFIDQFHEAFLEVDFINVFGTYQDTVEGKLQTVERLSKELEEMGVLDIDKLEYRKQA